ncbi:hypothetical protein [Psychrobacillus sp. L3]|uniref:hypothetical protein n=1 Tax=Psychrobacillus sp. L3 TaxID=3236891 RepID=UPI0036F41141
MGGVQTSLALQDKLSGPIMKMMKAMESTIKVMEKMDATANNLDTKGLSKAQSTIDSAAADMNRLISSANSGLNNATINQDKFNNRIRDGTSSMNGLVKKVMGLAAAYLSISAIKNFGGEAIEAAGNRIRAEQRLQSIMQNINGMTQTGIELVRQQAMELEKVTAIAADVGMMGQSQLAQYVYDPSNINAMTESMYNLATETYGVNVTQDQIKQTADLMGKAMMGQIDSLSRNGFKLSSILTDAELKMFKYGNEAERAGLLVQVLNENQTDLARAMASTPEGAWAKFSNTMTGVKETIGYGIIPGLMQITDLISNGIETGKFDSAIAFITNGFNLIVDAGASAVAFIIDNWDIVKNVLIGVGFVLADLALAWLIQWAVALWPVFAVIGAIVLLMTVLNHFGVSTADIIGFVGGLFNSLFAFLYNRVAYFWNIILAFSEFLFNVLIDPVYAIKKLFYDLGMNFFETMFNMTRSAEDFAGNFMSVVLKAINGIIGGVNQLSGLLNKIGFDIPQVSLLDENNIHTVSDKISGIMKQMESMKPTSDKNVFDFSGAKLAPENLATSFDNGFNAGNGLVNKLGNLSNISPTDFLVKDAGLGIGPTGDIGSLGMTPDGKIKGGKLDKIGKIEDKINIAEEDLKVLRELSDRKSIQNFRTLQPSFTFTGDMAIREEADIDKIVSKINESLENEMKASVEGAYT